MQLFFLNRTNRSGIISAGAIGGIEQKGNYKIDCRFNKNNLEKRIEKISLYEDKIRLSNLDALDFIDKIENSPQKSFLYIASPYYKQGSNLYTNFYRDNNHRNLAIKIQNLKNPWVLTYDDEPVVRDIYRSFRKVEFNLNYSVQKKTRGN